MAEGRLEWFSAKIAELVDLFRGRSGLRGLFGLCDEPKVSGHLIGESRVQKSKGLAVFVTLMGVEKHQDALVAEVALTESVAIKTVDLRVSQHIADSLQIDDHQVALCELP